MGKNIFAKRKGGSPIGFFWIWEFLYWKLEIRDFKAKSRRHSGLKVVVTGEMPKIINHRDVQDCPKFGL